MFLLNDRQIRSYVEDVSRSYLDIEPFEEELLQNTSYYFRLGTQYKAMHEKDQPLRELSSQNSKLIVPAGAVVKIRSLETFLLSNRVIAIFGQVSDLTNWGLQLLHSPFIDPTFVGQLDLGLFNPTNREVAIDWKQRIGKVCFFDVSDTYPVSPPSKGKLLARKFEERRPVRDDDPPHYDKGGGPIR